MDESDGYEHAERMEMWSDELKDEITSLTAKLTIAIEALESIGSIHVDVGDTHEGQTIWLGISHQECAETLANDTRIAREALRKISG